MLGANSEFEPCRISTAKAKRLLNFIKHDPMSLTTDKSSNDLLKKILEYSSNQVFGQDYVTQNYLFLPKISAYIDIIEKSLIESNTSYQTNT